MEISILEINKALSSSDNILSNIIEAYPINKIENEDDIYYALIKSIVSQQLSLKAADTIFNRFLDLFELNYPNPFAVIETDILLFRKAGLSFQKSNYIKNVATFASEFNFQELHLLSDKEILEKLTSIKGVGKWTAEMILIFSMGRLDIMPIDDLVVRNSIKTLYKLESEGKLLHSEILELSKTWIPYRSIASRYFWKWNDNTNRKKKI